MLLHDNYILFFVNLKAVVEFHYIVKCTNCILYVKCISVMAESDKTLIEDGNLSNNNRNNSVPSIVPPSSGTLQPDTHPTHHAAVSEPSTLKRKQTSFQITSVTVKGSRLSTDGGEDSADDLDESHTEDASSDILDCSRTTDVDNDQLSEDNNTNNDDTSTPAPSIPVNCKNELPEKQDIEDDAEVKFPSEASKIDKSNMLSENTQSEYVKPHALPDQWQHRFRVVKIVSSEPFKRGRWLCMDFMDPPAPITEAKVEIVETSVSSNIQLISGTISESIPADKIAHIYEISPSDAYPGSISVASGSDQIQQPMYGIFLPINNGQYPLITGMHSRAIRPMEREEPKQVVSIDQANQQAQNTPTSSQQSLNITSNSQKTSNVAVSVQQSQNIAAGNQQSQNAPTNMQQSQNIPAGCTQQMQNVSVSLTQSQNINTGLQPTSSNATGMQNIASNLQQSHTVASGMQPSQNVSSGLQQSPNTVSGLQQSQNVASGLQQSQNVAPGLQQSQNVVSGLSQSQNVASGLQQPQTVIPCLQQAQNTTSLQQSQSASATLQQQNVVSGLQQPQNTTTSLHQLHNVTTGLQQQAASTGLQQPQSVGTGLQQQAASTGLQQPQSVGTGLQQPQSVGTGLQQPQNTNICLQQPQSGSTGLQQPQNVITGLQQSQNANVGLHQNVNTGLQQPQNANVGLPQNINTGLQTSQNVTSGQSQPQNITVGQQQSQNVLNLQQPQNVSSSIQQMQNITHNVQQSQNVSTSHQQLQSVSQPILSDAQMPVISQSVHAMQAVTSQTCHSSVPSIMKDPMITVTHQQSASGDPTGTGSSSNFAATTPSLQAQESQPSLQSRPMSLTPPQSLSETVPRTEVPSSLQVGEAHLVQGISMQTQIPQVSVAQTSNVGTQASSVANIPDALSTSSASKPETVAVPSQITQNHVETKELGTPPSTNLQEAQAEVPPTKSDLNGEESESAPSGTSTVAIDNKIEQAMDLVKSHLMFAVREEVDVLKEKITELMDRISQLEYENGFLRANASQQTLEQLNQSQLLQQQQQQQPSTVSMNSIPQVPQQQQLNIQNQQPTS